MQKQQNKESRWQEETRLTKVGQEQVFLKCQRQGFN
jgi:hypothetical protein